MLSLSNIGTVLLLASSAFATSQRCDAGSMRSTCKEIEGAISKKSEVFYAGSTNYANDTAIYNEGGMLRAACSVEPGSPEDVSKILTIVGKNRTPFNVKGFGGQIPMGFANTVGVQIAMTRFRAFNYSKEASTLDLGAGLGWDEVFERLGPMNISVVGNRTPGTGIAGFYLGGGYGWHSNQHGAGIDTVVSMQVVTPEGKIIEANQKLNEDFFWAVRGSWNNFGIVTRFTVQAFPQTMIYGGLYRFGADQYPLVNQAVADFVANTSDPKAAIIPAYGFIQGFPIAQIAVFYDAPKAPKGMFDAFAKIKAMQSDVKTRPFFENYMLEGPPAPNTRLHLAGFPMLEYTKESLDLISSQVLTWANITKAASNHTAGIFYALGPFQRSAFEKASSNPSAYLRNPDFPASPFLVQMSHTADSPEEDKMFQDFTDMSARTLYASMIKQGQQLLRTDVAYYGPYSSPSAQPLQIWGDNLQRLRELKKKLDPKNIMHLTGGYKL